MYSVLTLSLVLATFRLVKGDSVADVEKRLEQEFTDRYGQIDDYKVPKYEGLCHACVFNFKNSVYATQSPVCIFEAQGEKWNVGEQIKRWECLSEDPRQEEGMTCRSTIANDTLECGKPCSQNRQGNPVQPMDMADDEAVFEDTRCNFHMEFWNATKADEQGVKIHFIDEYARDNLRFYKSDKPILGLTEGIQPNRHEIEKYRMKTRRDTLKHGDHLFVINMGRDIGRFKLTGTPKPLQQQPQVDLTPLWVNMAPKPIEQTDDLSLRTTRRKRGATNGTWIVLVILIIIAAAVVAVAIVCGMKHHKRNSSVYARKKLQEEEERIGEEKTTLRPINEIKPDWQEKMQISSKVIPIPVLGDENIRQTPTAEGARNPDDKNNNQDKLLNHTQIGEPGQSKEQLLASQLASMQSKENLEPGLDQERPISKELIN